MTKFTNAAKAAYLESLLQSLPELLGLSIAWVVDWEGTALGDNLLSGKWTLGVSPSRIRPPLLDSLDLSLESCLLLVKINSRWGHLVHCHCELRFVESEENRIGMMSED